MAWVRIDDAAPDHPKLVGLDDAAWAMWSRGLCYANRNTTDGRIPKGSLRRLSTSADPARVAQDLVDAGLWHPVDGGWEVHDYLDYQFSAAEVRASREEASEAKRRAGRAGGVRSGEARRAKQGTIRPEADPKQTRSRTEARPKHDRSPDPDPDPSPEDTHPAGAHEAPASAAHAASPPAPAPQTIASIQIPAVVELGPLVTDLAAKGNDYAIQMSEKLARGETLTAKQRTTIRNIADRERQADAPRPAAALPEDAAWVADRWRKAREKQGLHTAVDPEPRSLLAFWSKCTAAEALATKDHKPGAMVPTARQIAAFWIRCYLGEKQGRAGGVDDAGWPFAWLAGGERASVYGLPTPGDVATRKAPAPVADPATTMAPSTGRERMPPPMLSPAAAAERAAGPRAALAALGGRLPAARPSSSAPTTPAATEEAA